MTDKTSETKHKLCPIHVNRQLGETGYCMDCGGFPTKCSVGKAEDKSISIETGKNLSYVPKSEPCTHEPYWILWIEGENKLIHCSKCNGTWNIEKFAKEIRQQSELKGFNEGIDEAILLCTRLKATKTGNNDYFTEGFNDGVFAVKIQLENLKRSG